MVYKPPRGWLWAEFGAALSALSVQHLQVFSLILLRVSTTWKSPLSFITAPAPPPLPGGDPRHRAGRAGVHSPGVTGGGMVAATVLGGF